MSNRWDRHFLSLCREHARMSKDPSTQVGAVIVGPDREVRASGFNGFPRGITDSDERLNDRETKLSLIVHAEMNAILNAARIGVSTKGCTMYLLATDASGDVWGGPPCVRCAVEVIQSGITEIVSLPFKSVPSRWKDSIELARTLLCEAGVSYRDAKANEAPDAGQEPPSHGGTPDLAADREKVIEECALVADEHKRLLNNAADAMRQQGELYDNDIAFRSRAAAAQCGVVASDIRALKGRAKP